MKYRTYNWLEAQRRSGVRRWSRATSRLGRRFVPAVKVRITPPEVLSFAKNFGATVAFLEQLRSATLHEDGRHKRKHVYVDLEPVKTLSVPVAIVLAAEFHRWKLHKKAKLQPQRSSFWDTSVRNLLADLGVFELLGSDPVEHGDPGDENITLTPLESGLQFDGDKIDYLQSQFAATLEGFTRNPSLFEGLMEAAENAISHAYPADYSPPHPFAGHRWWGASCLDIARSRLRFFIFDQGAGIPYTLPKSAIKEKIVAWVAQFAGGMISDDAIMLKAAFEVGRTRTGLEHRGLGLQRMAEVVQGSGSGTMRIISGKAEIVYHHDGTMETQGLPRDIGGTLIEWNMPADIFELEFEGSDANPDN